MRSAEVTLEKGFLYFTIIDESNTNKKALSFNPPIESTTDIGGIPYTYTYGGEIITVSRPRSTSMIACFKENPQGSNVYFDAQIVSKAIREKYNLIKEKPEDTSEKE